ncbi:MAG: tetratricopeptide repeat protein [Flavobacteriaceae bacterium]
MKRATFIPEASSNLKKYEKGFTEGFLRNFQNVGNQIVKEVENGGFYDLISLRYDVLEKTYHLLFRLYSETSGLNYHDYQLVYRNEGEFKVLDVYTYTTGENLSRTINNIYLLSLPKTIVDKFLSFGKMASHIKLGRASQMIQKGNYKGAHMLLESLNGSLNDQKIFHVLNIQCSQFLNEETHLKALEGLRKHFPHDHSTNLMLIDYYILQNDSDGALTCIHRLEKSTQDNFLDYIRGNVYVSANQFNRALPYYLKTVENYPLYVNARLNIIACQVQIGDFHKAITEIDTMIKEGFMTKQEAIAYVEAEAGSSSGNTLQPLADSSVYLKWKNI